MKLPEEIQDFIKNYKVSELALIGCRADDPNYAYDCCEYDIAVLGGDIKNNNFDGKIIHVGNSTLELLNFQDVKGLNHISLSNMIKLGESNKLVSEYPKPDRKKMFIAAGKRRIVDSLFNVSRQSNKADLNANLNLKIAAYGLIEGILLISGTRPMPIHELRQLHQVEVHRDFIKEAIQTCIECLGIERAGRTVISRSFKALREILKDTYDVELLTSKIQFLLDKGLLADCYYYMGRLVCSHLEKQDNAFQMNYHKLNSIALDLTNDYEKVKKMSALLKRDCKLVLKN